jgi:phosphatidylglycerol---prolipoprotein diacylglyceryl transferase
MNFLHNFHPQSTALHLGPIAVRWYGVLIVIGIFLGLFLVLRLAKKYGVKKDDVYDLVLYAVISSIIGARIYAVLLFLPFYLENPFEIIAVWHGGLAIHGAILGGIVGVLLYCKKKKQRFWMWADLMAPALILGQAIGRWGNYFNQELYGTPTTASWGIPIDVVNRVEGFTQFEFFHPTFLYESVLNFLIFAILMWMHVKKIKSSKKTSDERQVTSDKGLENYTSHVTRHTSLNGNIALTYLVLYSVVRIIMEQFRIDETPELFGVRIPIVVSLVTIVISGYFIFKKKDKLLNLG